MYGRFCFTPMNIAVIVIKHLPKLIFGLLLIGLCCISLLAQIDLSTGVTSTVATPVPTPTNTPTPIPVPTTGPVTGVVPPDPNYSTTYCARLNTYDFANPFNGWPTNHPVYQNWAYLTTSFCDPSYPFSWEHEGLDFSWPLGTPVVATANAQVVQAGFHTNLGNLVVLCNNGFCARYAHLNNIDSSVLVGGTVSDGQQIGTVGNTGAYTTGPHLHYDIYDSGGWTDPRPAVLQP